MPCKIDAKRIEQTKLFHGHSCPGLAIGIRAAELALNRLGHASEIDLVAVAETDMCGVDAIQFLTGCTLGKGNFIHRDLGKMAFSFCNRETGQGFRALLKRSSDNAMGELMGKVQAGTATLEDKKMLADMRSKQEETYMQLELEDMFDIGELPFAAPRPAKILSSLACEACGELTMESRTRRFDGKTLCKTCFKQVEQKI